MMTAAIVSAVAAAGSVATQGVSMVEQSKARHEQKNLASLKQAKEARQQIAQARIAEGQAVNSAAVQGAQGSSGQLGGAGSIESQMASNIGYQSEVFARSNAMQNDLSSARTFSGYSSLASNVFSMANQYRAQQKVYSAQSDLFQTQIDAANAQ